MDTCSAPGGDMDDLIVKNYIGRMLSDNYTLLIVFVIVSFLILFVLNYFFKQARATYNDYKKNKAQSEQNSTDVNADNEIEPDENDEPVDTNKYQDPNRRQFYKGIDDIYKEYNVEKSKYIEVNYGKENDDYVDQKVAYKEYDNYNYKDTDK